MAIEEFHSSVRGKYHADPLFSLPPENKAYIFSLLVIDKKIRMMSFQ